MMSPKFTYIKDFTLFSSIRNIKEECVFSEWGFVGEIIVV